MRVLLLNYEFPPVGGGAGFATLNIARQLVKRGVEVHVLTARLNVKGGPRSQDGLEIFRVPSWRRGVHDCGLRGAWTWFLFAMVKRAALHRRYGYDLEHFFFSLPTGALSFVPTFASPVPYVVSLRGSDVPGYDPFNTGLQKIHGILKPVTRRIWRRASRVVALGEDLKQLALETSPDLNFDVIPNGVETDLFHPREQDQVRSSESPMRILTVSRLIERKGVQDLLRAISGMPASKVTLTIAGSGSYEDELRQLAETLGVGDRVEFLGFVPRAQLPEIYQRADVFALPSHAESFGMVFAEAMASGLPVIGGRVGGVPDLVRDGTDGLLVEPGDVSAIDRAVKRLQGDPTLRQQMGSAGRERIEEHYSWRGVAQRYYEIYLSSASGG